MEDCSLNRKQKNTLLEIMVQSRIDPKQFSVDSIRYDKYSVTGRHEYSCYCTKISHKMENYYFFFITEDGNSYSPRMRPGLRKIFEQHSSGDWNMALSLFTSWTIKLQEHLNEPDLWADLERIDVEESLKSIPDLHTDDEKTMLSGEQQQEFERRISYLEKKLLENKDVEPDRIGDLKTDLDYLKRGSKRLNIKDLKNVVLSTAIHIAYDIVTDDTKRNAVFSLIVGVLGHLPDFKLLPS
jgi:hypothetical protein